MSREQQQQEEEQQQRGSSSMDSSSVGSSKQLVIGRLAMNESFIVIHLIHCKSFCAAFFAIHFCKITSLVIHYRACTLVTSLVMAL